MRRTGDAQGARNTLFKVALAHHLAFDFQSASRAWKEALAHTVEPRRLEATARLQLLFPPPWDFVPGYVYTPWGGLVWAAPLPRARPHRRRAQPRPRPCGGAHCLRRWAQLQLSALPRRALERRCARQRRRLRLRLAADARGKARVQLVARASRRGKRPRRPHARGQPPGTSQLLSLPPHRTVDVPLAAVIAAKRSAIPGATRPASSATGRSSWPSSTTSTQSSSQARPGRDRGAMSTAWRSRSSTGEAWSRPGGPARPRSPSRGIRPGATTGSSTGRRPSPRARARSESNTSAIGATEAPSTTSSSERRSRMPSTATSRSGPARRGGCPPGEEACSLP